MAEIATKAGRALTAADSPNMFLNMDAAMVISESINSSFGTAENWDTHVRESMECGI